MPSPLKASKSVLPSSQLETNMQCKHDAECKAAKRRANPVREARRQAEITRMMHRWDYIPQYMPVPNGQRYVGHVRVPLNTRVA